MFLKVVNKMSNIFVPFFFYCGEFKTYKKVDRNNRKTND